MLGTQTTQTNDDQLAIFSTFRTLYKSQNGQIKQAAFYAMTNLSFESTPQDLDGVMNYIAEQGWLTHANNVAGEVDQFNHAITSLRTFISSNPSKTEEKGGDQRELHRERSSFLTPQFQNQQAAAATSSTEGAVVRRRSLSALSPRQMLALVQREDQIAESYNKETHVPGSPKKQI